MSEEKRTAEEIERDIYQPTYREFRLDQPPDRDHYQKVLTRKFVTNLLLRDTKTPDDVATAFAHQWTEELLWLGVERKDVILKDAMTLTGVDLSGWLSGEKTVSVIWVREGEN